MEKDLVSIIIPCYNASRYLKDVFLSIQNQTYQNIEAIFVDDGSKDDTGKMLDDFAKTYSKAIVVHQVNSGVSAARNRAIALAKGKYIYFIDSDDIVHPDTIRYCLELYEKYDPDLVMFDFKRFSDKLKYDSFKFTMPIKKKVKTFVGYDNVYANYLSTISERCVTMKMFKRDLLRKIPEYPKIFDEACYYGEDALLLSKLFQNCHKVVLSKAKLYNYRKVKNSLMHSSFKERELTVFKSEEVFSKLDQNVYKESLAYTNAVICFASMDLLYKLRHSDYQNPKVVNEIYHRYRDNLKYLPKLSRLTWPYRFGTLFTLPIMYLMVRKKLKG
ncbi:MAG: glycosyltransferase [Bacilli bacterium]|nr:glycosyltransferase [Bacilli bacterium]